MSDDDYVEPNEELLDEEDAEYSKKSEYSKPMVIQTQVMRCNELRSKEMNEGKTIRTFDKTGNYKIIDVPDTRQPYIGSVIALKNNLSPEVYRDKKIQEEIEKINDKIKELFEKYKYKELVLKNNKDRTYRLEYSGNEYLPKKGAVLTNNINKIYGKPAEENKVEGLWDSKVSAYWDAMVFLYDELFSIINLLIDKNEYFKEKSGW